jgi:hypothetical protein
VSPEAIGCWDWLKLYQKGLFVDMLDDIPALAIGAIGKINQTNPEVVRGIDSVPAMNPDPGKRDLRLTGQR